MKILALKLLLSVTAAKLCFACCPYFKSDEWKIKRDTYTLKAFTNNPMCVKRVESRVFDDKDNGSLCVIGGMTFKHWCATVCADKYQCPNSDKSSLIGCIGVSCIETPINASQAVTDRPGNNSTVPDHTATSSAPSGNGTMLAPGGAGGTSGTPNTGTTGQPTSLTTPVASNGSTSAPGSITGTTLATNNGQSDATTFTAQTPRTLLDAMVKCDCGNGCYTKEMSWRFMEQTFKKDCLDRASDGTIIT